MFINFGLVNFMTKTKTKNKKYKKDIRLMKMKSVMFGLKMTIIYSASAFVSVIALQLIIGF